MGLSFSGCNALVAGAGGGMGLAIANQLINNGINVCLADVKEAPSDINGGPGRSVYLRADLADQEDVGRIVASAEAEFGGIDYLVNTVGVLWFGKDTSVIDIEMDIWQQVMNINLGSMALLAKHVVPLMQKNQSGAMVHFSSIDALLGDPVPQDAYGASKAAMIRLSKSLAVQFAKDQIRSNVILPGPTMSPMQARWQGKEEIQRKVGASIPLGRLGSTDDLANACLFLLSDQASYITGTELVVDGGITAVP